MHHLTRYELGDAEGDDLGRTSMSATTRRASAVVRPPRSAPRPSWISSASIVSTSKWMATFVAPVVRAEERLAVSFESLLACQPPASQTCVNRFPAV